MELASIAIGVALFVGAHILFMVRPLFRAEQRLAILIGVCSFLSVFGVYALNGAPFLATSPPASFDVTTSLINQALTLNENNPEKAAALLREATRHSPSPSQMRMITILQRVNNDLQSANADSSHTKTTTPP